MKKIFLVPLFCFLSFIGFSQQIKQVLLSHKGNNTSLCFVADQNIIIKVNTDGQVFEWGVDFGEGRYNYYPGKLDKYMGRVEMYGSTDNVAYSGKVRYIGSVNITYFTAEENQSLAGKVKSIGGNQLDYNAEFEEQATRGKIKSAGSLAITYYGSFENESVRGKIKSIGNTTITYFTSFDDKASTGKIKSIGSFQFSYYSSFDTRMAGAMKNGFQKQLINGLLFIVWG